MGISIDETTCLNLKESLRLEWLDSNGLGGYASSSILNCHTRRYHGLLVSNLTVPPGRYVLLSKFEDSLVIRDREFFLSLHRYPNILAPAGHKYLRSFQQDLCPHFIYQIGDVVLHERIMMPYGDDSVMVQYHCESTEKKLILRIKPFLAFRDTHTLSRENLSLQVRTVKAKNGFRIQPYEGMPPLFIQTSIKSTFFPSPVWYRNFEYIIEAERGFDCHEDLFQPGRLEVTLDEGDTVVVMASTSECARIPQAWSGEETRRERLLEKSAAIVKSLNVQTEDKENLETLINGARHFRIHQPQTNKKTRPTIVAGYHWFVDWGRDMLIALPGSTFCCGETEHGVAVLKAIGKHERNGLLPNFFNDHTGEHAYNSVDCSLWYFWAVQQMLYYTGDWETVEKHIWPVLLKIVQHYARGTEHAIFMNEQGLLHAGDETSQLTWMDATVDGRPVTPRNGYAVDINALWYNAVCFMDELAERFGRSRYRMSGLAERVHEAFRETFWIGEGAYLGDVFTDGLINPAVRPNQILAVSLPYSPLDDIQSRCIVEKASRDLLTPFGLRTLSPSDKAYCGRYTGDSASRDAAYHQGTVWPWWVAHYGEAYLKVASGKVPAREFLRRNILTPLGEHLHHAGIGSVSEIFDGDPPHRPNGCIAQAWSVAELIRLHCIVNKERS